MASLVFLYSKQGSETADKESNNLQVCPSYCFTKPLFEYSNPKTAYHSHCLFIDSEETPISYDSAPQYQPQVSLGQDLVEKRVQCNAANGLPGKLKRIQRNNSLPDIVPEPELEAYEDNVTAATED